MRILTIMGVALALGGCNALILSQDPPSAGSNVHPEVGTPVVTDVISQTVQPSVDILWVVDNSCSMADKQDLLAQNFPRFMEYFLTSGLDYHIGLTTTDAINNYNGARGKLRVASGVNFITPQTASTGLDPVDIFGQMARLGTDGDAGYEAEAQPTYLAINRSIDMTAAQNTADPNYGFYRQDAALHVIVVTDEIDYSFSKGMGPLDPGPAQGADRVKSKDEFINWMNGLKSDPKIPVSYSAIAGPPPNNRWGLKPCNNADNMPQTVDMVSRIGTIGADGYTPGQFFRICETDWTPILDELGFLASSLHTSYYLTELPVIDSIEVTVTPPRKSEGTPVYEGVNDRSLPENYTSKDLNRACKALGAAACFSFHYNVVGNSIDMVGESDPHGTITGTDSLNARGLRAFVPVPKATVTVTYELRGAFEDVGDSDGFFGGADSGAGADSDAPTE